VRICHEHTWPDREGSAKEVRASHLSGLVWFQRHQRKDRARYMKGTAIIQARVQRFLGVSYDDTPAPPSKTGTVSTFTTKAV
jgi:hypothetical protein